MSGTKRIKDGVTKMKINTRDFGEMEINKRDILRFPDGLYAFEQIKDYALIKKEGPIGYLQSVGSEDPRFIVFDPDDMVDGYIPAIAQETVDSLMAVRREELELLVIAVIPENIRDMTVNLKSPIVINRNKGLAAQVILEGDAYPTRFRVFG